MAIIAGQVGAQGGAGAVTALTQRVVHATDDPVTASLAIMDDWDETDRAKVNLIAGSVGVEGGSGVSTAKTQRVVIATDQPSIDVDILTGTVTVTTGSPTATLTNQADQATSVQLLAAGTRKGFYIYNDSTVDLYVKFGTTASTTSFTQKLAAATGWGDAGIGIYQGRVDGIWASDAAGSARITEW